MIPNSCPDKTFEEMLKSNDFYEETKNNNKAVYLFYEYEVELSKLNNTDCALPPFETFCSSNYKRFEIEHIDPQQPHGRKPLESVNQVGNLAATFENKKLSNKEFTEKKNVFKVSILNIEKELVEYDKWDEQAIKKRAGKIIKFAKRRWGY